MLGGVTISNDIDQYDSKNLTLMMKCVVDQVVILKVLLKLFI